jgi:hypothetical protein
MKVTVKFHKCCRSAYNAWMLRMTMELGEKGAFDYEQAILRTLGSTKGEMPDRMARKSSDPAVILCSATYQSTMIEYQIKKRLSFLHLFVAELKISVTSISELPPDVLHRVPRR